MSKTRFVVLSVGAIGLALSLIGCGGGSPTSPPSPPAPVSNVVEEGKGGLGADTVGPVTFSTSASGTLDMKVQWTSPANDVDIFLARGTDPCTLETFNNRSCGFIATEESTTMKPSKLRVTAVAPGAYTLYIANFGDSDETVSWEIVLTTTASGASVSGSSVGRGTAKGALSRMVEPR